MKGILFKDPQAAIARLNQMLMIGYGA